MRRLALTFCALGLLVGLVCALTIHGLPRGVVGRFGWFGFTPATIEPGGFAVSITLNWFPSILALPALGLLVGLLVAAVLARFGWALTRSSSE